MHEVGGNCLKYLKRGWNRKEGRGNKDFKKGRKAASRGECLKKRGLEPPYKLWAFLGSKNTSNHSIIIITIYVY